MPNTLEFKAGQDYYFISTSTKMDIHRYFRKCPAVLSLHKKGFSERHLKGHSYENVCEIIALNDRLDPN
jgi:hypothetical protein